MKQKSVQLPDWKEIDAGFVITKPGSTIAVRTGEWRTFRPVIDYKRCTNCGWCWAYCPEPAITLTGGKYIVDYDHCKGCGICVAECPLKCIQLVREE